MLLDDEQKLIRDTARSFANKKLAVSANDRDKEAKFPLDQFQKLGELGFLGMLVPSTFGGSDAGSLLEQGRKFAFVVGHGYLPK